MKKMITVYVPVTIEENDLRELYMALHGKINELLREKYPNLIELPPQDFADLHNKILEGAKI